MGHGSSPQPWPDYVNPVLLSCFEYHAMMEGYEPHWTTV
jgi:hypothetical protein